MILVVKLKPGARTTAVIGWEGGTVCISVAEPPVDGRANDALIRFLSRTLGLTRRDVLLRRGATGRLKHVEIPDGTSLEALCSPS